MDMFPGRELADLDPAALLLLDRAGQVRYGNPASEAMLARLTMLSQKGGTLTARRKAEDRELREAHAAVSARHPHALVCLRNRESLPVVLIDMHLLAGGLVAWRITEVATRPVPSLARLRQVFGVTPAEARVAAGLLSGLGIQGIAAEHGVDPETVRTQVKRLRSKTGARSQNQLLGALVAASEAFAVQPDR